MITLSLDRRNKTLMARAFGIFSSDDIVAFDRAVPHVLAREGPLRGIFDFTDVEAVAVSAPRLAVRGRQPPTMRGGDRVFVAPQPDVARFCRTFAEHQRTFGNVGPAVVSTLGEAYALLGISNPQFEPIEVR